MGAACCKDGVGHEVESLSDLGFAVARAQECGQAGLSIEGAREVRKLPSSPSASSRASASRTPTLRSPKNESLKECEAIRSPKSDETTEPEAWRTTENVYLLQVHSDLVTYFLNEYHQGKEFDGDDYKGERAPMSARGKGDLVQVYSARQIARQEITGLPSVPVMQHEGTGIYMAEYPLDLRSGQGPAVVLFHYCNRVNFANIMRDGMIDRQVIEALHDSHNANHFGDGIFAVGKSPDQFGTKTAAICNNHWPKSEEPPTTSDEDIDPKKPLGGGKMHTGPDDPDNRMLCDALLRDHDIMKLADFCIPLIVNADDVYDIWVRPAPGLDVDRGCNRWGDQQWSTRDVKIVCIPSGGQERRLLDARLDVMKKRVNYMAKRWGEHDLEALLSLGILAFTLSGMKRDQEVEPLMRRWVANTVVALGEEHEFTIIAMGNLALTLRNLKRLEESEQISRKRFELADKALGWNHSSTLASIRGLRRTLAAMGRQEEAETLRREEDMRTRRSAR
jgi:hypothetical protein